MRNLINLILGISISSLLLISCQENKEETNNAAEETTAVNEEAVNTEETVEETTELILNANLATEEELKNNGVSEDLLAAIIANRPFISMNDLDALVAEGEDKEALYKKIFVPFNLNTTAEADFKMIPGVGERMAHEFEEYRPYTNIQQFRKEIGKYVDEAEVARYENYVFVPVELNTASEEDMKALPGVGDRMAHEFEEYRPYKNMEQFRKEISKYVDEKELARLERLVYLQEK